MEPRFGLVGTGYWADSVHAAGLAAHPGVELAAVWGRDPAKAAAVAARHGTAPVDEFGELLERVDAVAFAVPPDVQAPLAERAARAGRHVLLEKPLSTSVEAADLLVEAVEASGIASVVFFTRHFAPETASWLRDVAAGGGWDGGIATWLAALDQPGNPFGGSPWRQERGALWDVGPHALSALVAALGPVEEVVAVRGRGDTVQLALRHAGGGSSSASLSLTVPPAAEHVGTLLWGRTGLERMPSGRTVHVAYATAVSELLELIETGERDHPCDARFGAEIVRVLATAEERLSKR